MPYVVAAQGPHNTQVFLHKDKTWDSNPDTAINFATMEEAQDAIDADDSMDLEIIEQNNVVVLDGDNEDKQ